MKERIEAALEAAGLQCDVVVDAGNGDFLVASVSFKSSKGVGKGNQTLQNAHGGFAGKSLIENIQDDIDTCMVDYKNEDNLKNFIEGMCHALGILRNTDCDQEWELARQRAAASLVVVAHRTDTP